MSTICTDANCTNNPDYAQLEGYERVGLRECAACMGRRLLAAPIHRVACTWIDDNGYIVDLDRQPYAEVVLDPCDSSPDAIYCRNALDIGYLEALSPNVDGVWSSTGGNAGFIPRKGEIERLLRLDF
jgi:hypothetical protein